MSSPPPLHPGLADFAEIRRNRGLYIDKTPHFRRLLATVPVVPHTPAPPMLTHTHQFLARPRRFGKSLLVDTLEVWFQGLPPERSVALELDESPSEGLPSGWTSPSWLWDGLDAAEWHGIHGWHPVVRLDMSRVAAPTPADTELALQRYLEELVDLWAWRGVPWGKPGLRLPRSDDPPNTILSGIITALERCHGRKPVVLVDEYDAPVTRYMGTDQNSARAVAALRDFYRVLKDDDGLLYGVFVTGITRFARDHLFSAANNFTDVSDRETHAAVCGFTEEEVERDLRLHREALQALVPGFDEGRMLDEWRTMYNGYRFAPHPDTERVYNPFTLIHGLDRTLEVPSLRDLAVQGRWPSAWSETGHPALTVRLAADTRQMLPGVVQAGGTPPAPAAGLVDLERPDFARLMLDTGYYTWHGGHDGREPHLNFPNLEVAASWLQDILDLWTRPPDDAPEVLVARLHDCLARGDVPAFARRLETFVFGLARENLQSEACFRAILQTLFLQMAAPTQSEKSTQGGRSDHEITVGRRLYVVEVKYNRPAAEGLRQIRNRPYGREHLDTGRDVTAVALAWRHDKDGPRLECLHRDLHALLGEREAEPGAD